MKPRGGISSEMALINTLGHDLRSPLTAVRGAATLLLQGLDEIPREKQITLLAIIDRRVLQMSDRIEDIIAVCHLDAGDLSVFMERVLAERIVARSVDPDHPQGDGPVDVTPPRPDLHVQADLERATQVLRALIANAHRFAEPGAPVEVSVEEGSDEVHFVVADRGPGLEPAQRAAAFERLWHGPGGGPGLGLYLARGVARAQGGDVTVEPRPGGGSRFFFTLSKDG